MYKDSLMVFFEQGFNGTLVEIKRQDKVIYQEKFTTAQEIQLATVKNLGYNKEVREFSIRINNGNEVPIRLKASFKYVAVNYVNDTIYIDFLKYYPMYE